ncbi:MAG: LCP family protein [Oscillospiraceae bacterium]|nr:LCP family protein [Oscillospiraceae bacterium]
MDEQRFGKRKRIALIVICVVLGLVLAAMLGVTIYAEYLLGRLNYVDKNATLPTLSQEEIDAIQNGEGETHDGTGPDIDEDDVDWGEVYQTIGGDDNIVNVMLIGQDRRPGEDRARSDSMILVTFNKVKKTITMTSFMRDLYLDLPDGYYDDRINVAYYLGGMELLDKTLYESFGVVVDANVEVDFDQFQYIIDLLGGVEIELSEAEAKYINKKMGGDYVSAGLQTLDGTQALWYARNRSSGGTSDFGRTDRQRKVLDALITAYKDQSIWDMFVLLDDILPMVTTDLTEDKVVDYVWALFPMLSECEIITQRIPVDGGYYDAKIRGMEVLVPYMDVNRQALIDSLTNADELEE